MKRLLATLLTAMLAAPPAAADPVPSSTDVRVIAQLPDREFRKGDVFEIPINILADGMEIVSYAVELRYDRSVLRLLDVLPGLTPWYSTQPQYKLGVRGGSEVWVTGGAHSFGNRQKVLNVANLQFELISERTRPRFILSERGPLVRRDGFETVTARYSVEGEMDLYEVLMDSSFE